MNKPSSFLNFNSHPRPANVHVEPQALLCFSHLRWDFVFQRPQHLLGLAAANYRVFYIEEPEFAATSPHFRMRVAPSGVTVLTPVFDHQTNHAQEMRALVEGLQRSPALAAAVAETVADYSSLRSPAALSPSGNLRPNTALPHYQEI